MTALLAGINVLYLYIATIALLIIFWRIRAGLQKRYKMLTALYNPISNYKSKNLLVPRKGFLLAFCEAMIKLLLPMAIVTTFLYGVQLYFTYGAKSISLGDLMRLEAFFAELKSRLAFFDLHASTMIAIFAVVCLLEIFVLSAAQATKLSKAIEKFQKANTIFFIVLTLLVSFTFFGNQIGSPSTHIQLRIKTIREGYADTYQQIYEQVSQEVANQLAEKVKSNLPPPYQTALNNGPALNARIDEVYQAYTAAQEQYGSEFSQTMPKNFPKRTATSSNFHPEVAIEGDLEAIREGQPPEGISEKQIVKLKEALVKRVKSEGTRFLELEGGKRLVAHIPQLITARIKETLTREWTEAYPLLGPVIDAFADAIDDTVKERVEQAVDEIVLNAAQKPDQLDAEIRSQSQKIVENKVISISQQTKSQIDQVVEVRNAQMDLITQTEHSITEEIARVENKLVQSSIQQLRSSDEKVVQEAVKALTARGRDLQEEQVKEIMRIIETSSDANWRVKLYRESHCTWYQETTRGYYAAEVLLGSSSKYVTEEMKTKAAKYKTEGQKKVRVMDPGWI